MKNAEASLLIINVNVGTPALNKMPATAAIKIKIMPESPETNLESIKKEATAKINAEGGVLSSYVEEPIAFGLKALIATLAWPEAKSTDLVEQIFSELEGVSSVSIIDYRRALG